MTDESGRESIEQQLGSQLLAFLKNPSASAVGKANGAVGGLNLIVIVVMFVYQVFVVPTKAELSALEADVADVSKNSATKLDLDRMVAAAQKDMDGIRMDVRDLKSELRDASNREVPTWLTDRLRNIEVDVRMLRGPKGDEDNK